MKNYYMNRRIKILCVVGARPNFIKIAPLFEEFKRYKTIKPILVHTGQHYDFETSQVFFQELKIPKPDYNLEVGSGTHAWQTAKIMEKLELVILKEKPDLVIVVGDVNSTLAGALTAIKLNIPVAHIEAGLRSFDMSMPEEINRLLTDHISDYLFVTESSGVRNLLNENISKKKIYFVGNIMIDTLVKLQTQIQKSKILEKLNLKKKAYAVLTLHRPENVDKEERFLEILAALKEIQKIIKIVWPIHPRTKKQIKEFKFDKFIKGLKNLILIKPLGYIEMINLMENSKFVITDSGGIQEETTFLKVLCLTFRKNTERPVTVEIGTNTLCTTGKMLVREANNILKEKSKKGCIPKYWDGKSATRIVNILFREIKLYD